MVNYFFVGMLVILASPLTALAVGHARILEEVVVEADNRPARAELGLSAIELSGDDLVTKLGATLGETLANEPGVHNASYGPGVGLPVLRGLSGVRVRLSEDGVGAWDASSISPDHATAIEPVLAEKIQVVKGAATVIHGNNAVGGTVEVVHGRIAETLTGQVVSSTFEVRKELENDHERESYVGKVKTELGKFVLQLDGFTRNSNDMSIPGLAIEEDAIEDVFGISNSDNTFGRVLNSDSNSHSGSLALSFIDNDFFVGGSTTTVDSEYGIPPGAHTEPPDSPGHSHSHPIGDNIVSQARVRIDLEQERQLFKMGGAVDLAQLDTYRLTVGKVQYTHREFERDPLTDTVVGGTRFFNDVLEVKAEFDHNLLGFVNEQHYGRFGLQWVDREFMARSERIFGGEDYIPATEQQTLGLFMYEQFPFQWGSVEMGVRYEWQTIKQRELTAPLLPDDTQFFHEPITYQTYTFSTAFTFDVTEAQSFIVNLNSAQRAPEITTRGPKTSFNVGRIGGGTSINSIPFESWMEVDMRSLVQHKLDDMDAVFQSAMKDGVAAENAARTKGPAITLGLEMVGKRPAGMGGPASPLIQHAMAAMNSLDITPTLRASSTDANIPISLGIPAITLRRGGISKGAHGLGEVWIDKDSHIGVQLALLTVVQNAGLARQVE